MTVPNAIEALVITSLALAPALLFLRNLRDFRPPPLPRPVPPVSVLIPARNEEASIRAAVASVLASVGVECECIVLDDHSEDRTAAIVAELAATDARVRLVTAPPLPQGWSGKQHACFALAGHAKYDLLAFLDADVRLAPDGLARLAAFQVQTNADLVSGFPHQETGTLAEKLVLPLMHFVLLGFLPLWQMRRSVQPSLGAGCGQLFLATRAGYDAAGGHAAVKASFHDGVKLPRAFRAAGRMTDLCDATNIATCRMYTSAGQVWRGLAKNAREGLGSPRTIVPFTLILVGGQVLPFAFALAEPSAWALAACALAWLPRFLAAWRFRQSWLGAVLHPIGILLLLAIQWYALVLALCGRSVGWKGRPLPETTP